MTLEDENGFGLLLQSGYALPASQAKPILILIDAAFST